jgi:hypothetical protein
MAAHDQIIDTVLPLTGSLSIVTQTYSSSSAASAWDTALKLSSC